MRVALVSFVLAVVAFKACQAGCRPGWFDLDTTGVCKDQLVFRTTAGIGKSVYKAYTQWQCNRHVEAACKTNDFRVGACKSHYRNNHAIEEFKHVKEVRLVIFKHGVIAKSITFNARGRNNINWFDRGQVLQSRWQDIKTAPSNIFSISGDHRGNYLSRRFFMSSSYKGCPLDFGWFTVIDSPNRPCAWEKRGGKWPAMLFAVGSKLVNFNNNDVEAADGFALYFVYEDGRAPGVTPEQMKNPVQIGEYFDMANNGRKEYQLASRLTANTGRSAHHAFFTPIHYPIKPGCKTINWWSDCTSHYRNDNAYKNFRDVEEVLVVIVRNGLIVKRLRFNARGQNYFDKWFSKCNYIRDGSSYADIPTSPSNIFSLNGHWQQNVIQRRFFANRSYGGCNHDYGWLVVIDGPNRPCKWEQDKEPYPIIKFSPSNKFIHWSDPAVLHADSMAIFFKRQHHHHMCK